VEQAEKSSFLFGEWGRRIKTSLNALNSTTFPDIVPHYIYEGLFFIGGIGPLAVRVGTIEPQHLVFLKLQVLGYN